MKRICLLFITFLLLSINDTVAWDGERKGFIFGIGLGGGISTINIHVANMSYSDTRGGLALSSKIGIANTNKTMFYLSTTSCIYVNKVKELYDEWGEKTSGDDLESDFYKLLTPFVYAFGPIGLSHSVLGVGSTFFFNESKPSLFISGSIGGCILYDAPYENKDPYGLTLGIGYETKSQINFSCDIVYGPFSDKVVGISVLLSMGVCFY